MSVSTDIDAPARAVRRVLTDFGRYGQWHPVMSLDGPVPLLYAGRGTYALLRPGKASRDGGRPPPARRGVTRRQVNC